MGSCDWPVDRTCFDDLPAENDPTYDAAVAQRNDAENKAIAVLFALTGRQFMCETKIVRPSPGGGGGICDDGPLVDAYYRNDWRGVPGAKASPMTVRLEGPAREIVTVTIDGVDIDPSEYRLEGDVLYRIGKRWPRNDMSKPRGFPGTWSVEYIMGSPPPPFVGGYVGQLAREMINACKNTKCKLPRTVVSTSRSGVTHVFDPTRMLAAGFTGLPDVDTWIAAVNPHNLAQTAKLR